jgi:hypothetical protein
MFLVLVDDILSPGLIETIRGEVRGREERLNAALLKKMCDSILIN